MKLVYISDKESALGFGLLGIETVIVSDKESALRHLNKFKAQQDVGIILITDTTSFLIRKEVDEILLSKEERPLIFEVPSIKNAPGVKKQNIKEFLRETIGISI
ncbi:MAG: V-type ATP synthase subunit F [Candidatus Omnitrophica bacterium]|nr:V-type ATP synthase subunit F [Candidatus Omnitrophota bacterium]